VRARWQHAEIPLSQFVPIADVTPPLREGDPLIKVQVTSGKSTAARFFVDNLRIFDRR
jgi:hypothetical protein